MTSSSNPEDNSKTTSGNEADEEPSTSTNVEMNPKLENVKDILDQPEPRFKDQKMYPPAPKELRDGPVTESEESLSSSTSQSSDDDRSARRRRRKASVISHGSRKSLSPKPAHQHSQKRKSNTRPPARPIYINVDPNDSPYYPSSSHHVLKPSVHVPRRVGALGISISSHSEDALSFFRRSGSQGDDTDDHKMSTSLDDSGESNDQLDTHRAISESSYRAIVDDLVKENKQLKSRLRQFEAPVSKELRDQRLLSVQFFERMPSARQKEMEKIISRYVSHLAASDALPPPLKRLGDASAAKDGVKDSDLAGPSNSGFEPASYSGTGFGMKVDGRRKNKAQDLVMEDLVEEPELSPGSEDERKAQEIVQVLEGLFREAVGPSAPSKPSAGSDKNDGTTSNEAYLSRMLNQDVSHEGWTYLNLISTMGKLHRFNVTPPFVRAAIKRYSTRLEVSGDGSKVRWRADASERPHLEDTERTNSGGSGSDSVTSSMRSSNNTSSNNHSTDTAATSIAPPSSGRDRPEAKEQKTQVKTQGPPAISMHLGPLSRGSSEDESTDSSIPPPATASMVFYANGQFWSDLNKNEPSSSEELPSRPLSSESTGAKSDGDITPSSEESVELKVYDQGAGVPRRQSLGDVSWLPKSDHFEFQNGHYFPARRPIKREHSHSDQDVQRKSRPRALSDAAQTPLARAAITGSIAARRRKTGKSGKLDSADLPRLRIGKVGIPIWSDDDVVMDDAAGSVPADVESDDTDEGGRTTQNDDSGSGSLPTPADTPDYLSSLAMGKYEWSPSYSGSSGEEANKQTSASFLTPGNAGVSTNEAATLSRRETA